MRLLTDKPLHIHNQVSRLAKVYACVLNFNSQDIYLISRSGVNSVLELWACKL